MNRRFTMKIIIDTKENIASLASDQFINLLKRKPNAVLGLATGSTPIDTYKQIIKKAKEQNISFKDVKTFNLDEYVNYPFYEASYRFFMDDNLFNHVDINKENTHFPSNENYLDYDNQIKACGGVDLQILGIGANGHIGFNEPNTPFDSLTHVTDLQRKTIEDNARFFSSIDEVPTKAITMGLTTIMNSKEIILIALGENKADAIKALVDNVGVSCPASILNGHDNVTIYCDKAAASKL